MACGGCAKRRAVKNAPPGSKESLMGGYKYLTDRQLRARLEIYKRTHCKNCKDRFECDYGKFMSCKKVNSK
ncbi:MAG: hypothetical protein PVG39_10205 [Desulfobacteraceae bacterium]|jgi:hypothetical protein